MSYLTQTPKKKHFAVISDQELAFKEARLRNKNTLNAERHAVKVFKQFLAENGAELTQYTEKELDKMLAKFWFSARTEKNEYYQVNTLRSFCYGLN